MATYTRTPFLIVHRVEQARKDVYGAIDDALVLQAQLLRGAEDSDTALVAMHPIGSPGYLPAFSQLARSGHHVVACATRYSTGDAALQMENVLVDLAACVRHTREHLGYRKIALVGWSGGGSIMAAYQAEAEQRVIVRTAAGEETPLAQLDLIKADALLLLATHRSRHHLLTGQLDAAITDEREPENRDASLDLYDERNPDRPPYSAEFLAAYRAAQLARNRRITAGPKDKLAAFKAAGRPHDEFCFVVHGTMADPRWLDPAIEPNGRRPRWTYLGDPAIVNDKPGGPRTLYIAAQLAVAMELRRRADRLGRCRAAYRRSDAADHGRCGRCLPRQPHRCDLRGPRRARQAKAYHRRRQPLFHGPRGTCPPRQGDVADRRLARGTRSALIRAPRDRRAPAVRANIASRSARVKPPVRRLNAFHRLP